MSTPRPTEGAEAPPPILSDNLLRGAREVIILHGGEAYRLRLTRNDKLILTK
jgi:hemin uptake protein HemP